MRKWNLLLSSLGPTSCTVWSSGFRGEQRKLLPHRWVPKPLQVKCPAGDTSDGCGSSLNGMQSSIWLTNVTGRRKSTTRASGVKRALQVAPFVHLTKVYRAPTPVATYQAMRTPWEWRERQSLHSLWGDYCYKRGSSGCLKTTNGVKSYHPSEFPLIQKVFQNSEKDLFILIKKNQAANTTYFE